MSSALSELGIDPDDFVWQDLGLCNGQKTSMFYDDYESSEQVAAVVDEMCLSCPVMAECLSAGIENKEWGVWGAVFLVSGQRDKTKNSHKTPEVWERIKERIV